MILVGTTITIHKYARRRGCCSSCSVDYTVSTCTNADNATNVTANTCPSSAIVSLKPTPVITCSLAQDKQQLVAGGQHFTQQEARKPHKKHKKQKTTATWNNRNGTYLIPTEYRPPPKTSTPSHNLYNGLALSKMFIAPYYKLHFPLFSACTHIHTPYTICDYHTIYPMFMQMCIFDLSHWHPLCDYVLTCILR